jgi:C-terminal processing protease CtpA/Prc
LAARGVAIPDTPAYTLALTDGTQRTLTPQPIAIDAYMAWTGGRLAGLPQRAAPLTLSRRNEAFWLTTLDAGRVIYVQYNQVRRSTQGGESLSAFAHRLAAALDERPVRRMVLDLRHNGGGDNTTYGPLLGLLRQHRRFQRPGALYVIIGRQTFSAATNFVTELERARTAIFAGEPTGGSPNLYGDTRPVSLPNSRLVVQISARYWQKSMPTDTRDALAPQIAVALTSQDFFGGRDPVLAAVIDQPYKE